MTSRRSVCRNLTRSSDVFRESTADAHEVRVVGPHHPRRAGQRAPGDQTIQRQTYGDVTGVYSLWRGMRGLVDKLHEPLLSGGVVGRGRMSLYGLDTGLSLERKEN